MSSLLFTVPLLSEDSEIAVLHDLKSQIIVGQTLEVLEQAGIIVHASEDLMHYRIPGNQKIQGWRIYRTG